MKLKHLTFSGVCLALCMVLPFLTLQTAPLGNMFSLIHMPVFLCGFVCGWPYGMAVGAAAPLLRHFLFGMPQLYPNAIAMTVELLAYGTLAGLLYRRMPKRTIFLYLSLAAAMLIGRLAWGAAMLILLDTFTFSYFIATEFVKAFPGILCHLILIPPLVMALERAFCKHEGNL